ncbi:hypothetical protein Q5P01_010249 [Channa striata]|uniref:Uncharacterized protein n=1 Tax=Channa striata TaxID=64152 RepID=A0AA88N1T2_CHASR|nr:hypothetical protein Q5P01_010249 [Channa striata]
MDITEKTVLGEQRTGAPGEKRLVSAHCGSARSRRFHPCPSAERTVTAKFPPGALTLVRELRSTELLETDMFLTWIRTNTPVESVRRD